MSRARHEVFAIVRDFAMAHSNADRFDSIFSQVEVEELLEKIDRARELPDEPAEEDTAKDLGRIVLENMNFGPVLAGVYYSRYLRGIEEGIKKNAEANLLRSLLECQRFLVQVPDDTAPRNKVALYMARLTELWESLSSEEDEKSRRKEQRAILETVKELAHCECTVSTGKQRGVNLWMDDADFGELFDAVMQAGGNMEYWTSIVGVGFVERNKTGGKE